MSVGLQGEACQGGRVPEGGWSTARDGLLQRTGVLRRPERSVVGLGRELMVPADGRMPEGVRDVTSIA